jgi:hypothetical protein
LQFRIGLIALENLVMALMADASQRRLAVVHEMPTHITM